VFLDEGDGWKLVEEHFSLGLPLKHRSAERP
jgi:hypothetical protein